MASGPWIQTFPGNRRMDFLEPKPEQIDIRDIAHHLAHVCRYTGAVARTYSVAEHSVRVAMYLLQGAPEPTTPGLTRQRAACYGLMHDASEAYLGDVSSPIKRLPEMEGYRKIEERLQRAIYNMVGLTDPEPFEVRHADLVLLATEHRELQGPEPESWEISQAPLLEPQDLGWDPTFASAQFLSMFSLLFTTPPAAKGVAP